MANQFEQPSYEKYLKASEFAKFKYKYGLVVQLIAVFLLALLIFFIIIYGQELAQHPLTYAADKTNSICRCTNIKTGEVLIANSTTIIKGEGINFLEGLG